MLTYVPNYIEPVDICNKNAFSHNNIKFLNFKNAILVKNHDSFCFYID